jgi:hypothetical protein
VGPFVAATAGAFVVDFAVKSKQGTWMNIIIIVNLIWANQTRSSITIITISKTSLSKLNLDLLRLTKPNLAYTNLDKPRLT